MSFYILIFRFTLQNLYSMLQSTPAVTCSCIALCSALLTLGAPSLHCKEDSLVL